MRDKYKLLGNVGKDEGASRGLQFSYLDDQFRPEASAYGSHSDRQLANALRVTGHTNLIIETTKAQRGNLARN